MIASVKSVVRLRQTRIALAVAMTLAPTYSKATTSFSCAPTELRVITQTTNNNRISTSDVFADVPQTTTNITTTKKGCVIVEFSALVSAGGGAAMFLTALLDGSPSIPDYSQVIASSSAFEARSVTFVFSGVPAGTHTVELQFRSSQNGTPVYINRGNLLIHHTP